MPGRRCALLLLVLAIFAPALLAETQGLPTVMGNAYDRESGQLLYVEYHFCLGDHQLCTVQYRDSYGELFALKELDYRPNPIAPALTLTDYRRDHQIRVANSGAANLVVDAGFDNYVRRIWNDLERGKTARFPFLVAGFDKPFNMRAERADQQACGQDELCLEIKVDSWLLGILASPIELAYSREDRKLLRFSGVSNIKGKNGESLHVDILYAYGDALLTAGSLHQQSTEYTF